MEKREFFVATAAIWMVGLGLSSMTRAQGQPDADLAEASRFVETLKELDRKAPALGAGSTDGSAQNDDFTDAVELPRFYRPGDRWLVATSYIERSFVNKVQQAAAPKSRILSPEFFLFEVLEVDNSRIATVRVVKTDRKGARINDEHARAEHLTFTLDRSFSVLSKNIQYRDNPAPVTAHFNAAGAVTTGFDSFPIALPDFRRGQPWSGTTQLPVPPEITSQALRPRADAPDTVRIESPDLFFRPVRVAWKKGDLWPAYVETKSGITVLVSQEKK